MRNWAQWCIDHNLKLILYMACIFVQLPLALTICIGHGILEAYEDVKDTFTSIQKAK